MQCTLVLSDCAVPKRKLTFVCDDADYVLAFQTRVIDPALVPISCDATALVLPKTDVTLGYTKGLVLVGPLNSASGQAFSACTAFSRRIVSATVGVDSITLGTVAASLEEIFYSANIDIPDLAALISLPSRRSLLFGAKDFFDLDVDSLPERLKGLFSGISIKIDDDGFKFSPKFAYKYVLNPTSLEPYIPEDVEIVLEVLQPPQFASFQVDIQSSLQFSIFVDILGSTKELEKVIEVFKDSISSPSIFLGPVPLVISLEFAINLKGKVAAGVVPVKLTQRHIKFEINKGVGVEWKNEFPFLPSALDSGDGVTATLGEFAIESGCSIALTGGFEVDLKVLFGVGGSLVGQKVAVDIFSVDASITPGFGLYMSIPPEDDQKKKAKEDAHESEQTLSCLNPARACAANNPTDNPSALTGFDTSVKLGGKGNLEGVIGDLCKYLSGKSCEVDLLDKALVDPLFLPMRWTCTQLPSFLVVPCCLQVLPEIPSPSPSPLPPEGMLYFLNNAQRMVVLAIYDFLLETKNILI